MGMHPIYHKHLLPKWNVLTILQAHGDVDEIVDIGQMHKMKAALDEAGVENEAQVLSFCVLVPKYIGTMGTSLRLLQVCARLLLTKYQIK